MPSSPLRVEGDYGRYQRRERADPGRLSREDDYELRRGRIAPSELPAFASFARAVDTGQGEPMVFRRADAVAEGALPVAGSAREEALGDRAVELEPAGGQHQAIPEARRQPRPQQ